jgi:hypothetical protein
VSERGFLKLTVRFSIQGTLDTVQQTLAAIATTNPALFVDSYTITAPESAGPAADAPPMLNLELDVAGYMLTSRS